MVFALLTRHWLARRHYPFASWAACIVRSLRVLLFRRAHVELLAMDVYRNYVTPVHDDVFHHLSHRNYLARGLSLRQRVRCTLTHSRFEDVTFDAAYKQAVYRDGGRRSDADADGERPAPAPPVVQLGRRTFRRPGRTRRGRHPAVHRPQPGAPR
jgi:hypothetical protein